MNRIARIVAGLAALALLTAACGTGSSSGGGDSATPGTLDPDENQNAPTAEGAPEAGGVLRFAVEAETDGYNPVTNLFALSGNLVASSIYDPLLKIDEERRTVPYLAEVSSNADSTVWTIRARPGVMFHDGTDFDGEAIRINLEQRRLGSLTAIALEPVDTIRTVDAMSVEVTMREPWSAFDYLLAAQTGYMVSPTAMLNPDGTLNPEAESHPVGTGPFVFEEHVPGVSLTVTRNHDYWQDGKPYLDGVEFQIVPDATTRAQSLESRAIDAMITERPSDVERFRSEPGFVQAEDLSGEESFVMLNERDAPFVNIEARRAIAYATDPRAIVDIVGGGLPPVATSPYTADEQWFVADDGHLGFDLDKAKEAVAAYKAQTGEPSLSFELLARPGEDQSAMVQTLQQQWLDAGIDARLTTLEPINFLLTVAGSQFQAATFRSFANVDPDFLFNFLHSSKAKGPGELSVNFTQTRNDTIDEALEQGRAAKDPAVRKDAYATVVREVNAELPYVWLYHNLWAFTANDVVGGVDQVAALGFSRQDAKPWWPDLWLDAA